MRYSWRIISARGQTTDYSRLYRLVAARRDQGDADDLREWRGPDIGALAWTLGRRALCGSLLRVRMGHAAGLIFADRNVRLLHASYISAGRDLNLEEGCQIMGLSRRGIVFGDRCTVGRYAMISPTNAFGGELGEGLKLGDHSNVGPFAYLGCSGYIEIGERVLMGPRVTMIAENHNFDEPDLPIKAQGVERKAITIGDDCWLGAGCTVLAGVTVGRGAVIAAGAVVTRDVPATAVVAGVPARVVRERKAAE
jgi:acetyltransferase-like isoleucine patch superfamily enzyme